jgi:hypothetical protein
MCNKSHGGSSGNIFPDHGGEGFSSERFGPKTVTWSAK